MKPQVILPSSGTAAERKEYDDRVMVDVSKSSWQTTSTWYQWIQYIARIIHEEIGGKHVIFVDSYRVHFAHPTLIRDLKEIYDVLLYPLIKNATQYIQPMDQRVIPTLKRHIRSSDTKFYYIYILYTKYINKIQLNMCI